MDAEVVIVGAGLAGLNCAKHLASAGIAVTVLEASDAVGGRVRTDQCDGFLLDRGFQVFQTAYPEARSTLDYEPLELIELEPGALVRKGGSWHRMSDPLRRPANTFATLFNGIGSISDRLRLLKLLRQVSSTSIEELIATHDDQTTEGFLKAKGFSKDFLESFLRPWISGMFLERKLSTSAAHFCFVFKMLSQDRIAYPRLGMQAIPEQLANHVGHDRIRLRCPAASISEGHVELAEDANCEERRIGTRVIVLAVDAVVASKMLGQPEPEMQSTCCDYFAVPPTAMSKRLREKSLMLNGEGAVGSVNHVFVPTNTIPELSPDDRALVSVTRIEVDHSNETNDLSGLRSELHDWFGDSVESWEHLRSYRIEKALPNQPVGFFRESGDGKPVATDQPNVLLCGDYMQSGSINGALGSGRKAAEHAAAILRA